MLPILALLLSYVIIAVPATMAYVNLKLAARHGSDVIVRYHKLQIRVSHEHFLRDSILGSAEVTSQAIQAVNMSGFITEVGVNRCIKTWPKAWAPSGLDLLQWWALSFPIACLPFWWFAGMGIDSLLGNRRLPWLVLLLGTTLCICFAVIELSLLFRSPYSVKPDPVPASWLCGIGLWSLLLAAFPVAWIRKAIALQRTRESLEARLFAESQ